MIQAWIFSELRKLGKGMVGDEQRSHEHRLDFYTRDWSAVGTGVPHYSEHYLDGQRQELSRIIDKYDILSMLKGVLMLQVQNGKINTHKWVSEWYGKRQLLTFIYRLRNVSPEVNAWYLEMQKIMKEAQE
jgi:hypothetical protein